MIDWRILQGDCLKVMQEMDPGTVQCVVSSPPYWGLRDYGVDGQMGLEKTIGGYVDKTVEVFKGIKRILRNDGSVWWNLGDSYNASGDYNPGGLKEGQPTFPGRNDIMLKPKDMCLVPFRVALALQSDGWWVRSVIIWAKPNPMPESCTDRPVASHEYVFLLSKSSRYFYDRDAVLEPLKTSAAQYLATGKKIRAHHAYGEIAGRPIGKRSFESVPAGRNLRTVWNIATKPYQEAHFATFPEKLVEPCIKAGTPKKACPHCRKGWKRMVKVESSTLGRGYLDHIDSDESAILRGRPPGRSCPDDYKRTTLGFEPDCDCPDNDGSYKPIVVDPFCGSGTVGVVALKWGCQFTGIELNPEYIELAKKRIGKYADGRLFV